MRACSNNTCERAYCFSCALHRMCTSLHAACVYTNAKKQHAYACMHTCTFCNTHSMRTHSISEGIALVCPRLSRASYTPLTRLLQMVLFFLLSVGSYEAGSHSDVEHKAPLEDISLLSPSLRSPSRLSPSRLSPTLPPSSLKTHIPKAGAAADVGRLGKRSSYKMSSSKMPDKSPLQGGLKGSTSSDSTQLKDERSSRSKRSPTRDGGKWITVKKSMRVKSPVLGVVDMDKEEMIGVHTLMMLASTAV